MQLNITHFHKQNQKRNVKIVAEGDFQKTFLKLCYVIQKVYNLHLIQNLLEYLEALQPDFPGGRR